MKNENIKKINAAGTVGYIASIILIVLSITAMVVTGILTCAAFSVAKENVNVSVASDIKVSSTGDILERLNSFISLDGIDDLTELATEDGEAVDTDDSDVSSVQVTGDDGGYTINVKTNEITFSIKKIIVALIVSLVTLGTAVLALYMVKGLTKALRTCETPFAPEVIKRMTYFANSLIPVAVMGMICDAIWTSVTTGNDVSLSLNVGSVLLIAVVYLMVVVFKYGAQLQRESDETL